MFTTATLTSGAQDGPRALEIATEQAQINELIARLTGDALVPIFIVLHSSPTPKMRAEVSRALLELGLDLWLAFLEHLEAKKPEDGHIPEAVLAASLGAAASFGAPIVNRLTHQLDLRPNVMQVGGIRPLPVVGSPVPSAQPVPTWQAEAAAELERVAISLRTRGLAPTPILMPSGLNAYLDGDHHLCVSIRVSSVSEAEPFTFGIDRLGDTLVRCHSTSRANLFITLDAFMAGRRDGLLSDESAKPPSQTGVADLDEQPSAAVTPWREEATAELIRTQLDLESLGFECILAAERNELTARLDNDFKFVVIVRISSCAARPFVLTIGREQSTQQPDTILVDAYPTTRDHLIQTVVTCLAVRADALYNGPPSQDGSLTDLAEATARHGVAINMGDRGFVALVQGTATRRPVKIHVEPGPTARQPFSIRAVQAINADRDGGVVCIPEQPASFAEAKRTINAFLSGLWSSS